MSPIKTIIRNLTEQAFNIYWAGKREVYLPAKGERIIEAEVWSEGTSQQRDAVIAAAQTGSISLSLLIMSTGGDFVEVPYCPQFAAVSYVPPVVVQSVEAVPAEKAEGEKEEEPIKLDDSFNVIATTDESRETLAKLGARPAEEIEREPVPALEFEQKTEEVEEAEKVAKPAKKTRSKK